MDKKVEMIDSVKILYVLIWNRQFYFSNKTSMWLFVPLLLEQIWNERRSRKFKSDTCCTLLNDHVNFTLPFQAYQIRECSLFSNSCVYFNTNPAVHSLYFICVNCRELFISSVLCSVLMLLNIKEMVGSMHQSMLQFSDDSWIRIQDLNSTPLCICWLYLCLFLIWGRYFYYLPGIMKWLRFLQST